MLIFNNQNIMRRMFLISFSNKKKKQIRNKIRKKKKRKNKTHPQTQRLEKSDKDFKICVN